MSASRTDVRTPDAQFVHVLIDMGIAMLACGAEVRRVEDTLARIGRAYGATRMNVFVITACIIATMSMPDGSDITDTRRITAEASNDFTALEMFNSLSREYCARPFSTDELERRAAEISGRKRRVAPIVIGFLCVAPGYTLFFGGSATDAAAAVVLGAFVWIVERIVGAIAPSTPVFNAIVSFICGWAICSVDALAPSLHTDIIMMSMIMLIVPGIAMTNAIRDIITGHTITGSMRFIESMVWAASIAAGFTLAILIARP